MIFSSIPRGRDLIVVDDGCIDFLEVWGKSRADFYPQLRDLCDRSAWRNEWEFSTYRGGGFLSLQTRSQEDWASRLLVTFSCHYGRDSDTSSLLLFYECCGLHPPQSAFSVIAGNSAAMRNLDQSCFALSFSLSRAQALLSAFRWQRLASFSLTQFGPLAAICSLFPLLFLSSADPHMVLSLTTVPAIAMTSLRIKPPMLTTEKRTKPISTQVKDIKYWKICQKGNPDEN
jgi:hypothetical protein